LTAVENKQTTVAEIEAAGRAQLHEHRKDSIRLIAQKLFSNSPCDSVIADYRTVLQRQGRLSRGEMVYKRECSGCHHIRDMGYEVGPDLASSPSRNPDALLTNILDPNRSVDPAFLHYLIIDKSGRTFSGKIVAETATSITLTSDKGRTRHRTSDEHRRDHKQWQVTDARRLRKDKFERGNGRLDCVPQRPGKRPRHETDATDWGHTARHR
jgi:putative heme-binding domain-containing protein